MAEVMIWDPFERLFWGVVITIYVLTAILYLYKGSKRENFNEKILMFGMASLFLGVTFDRFFRYLSEFLIPGSFVNYVFYGDYSVMTLEFELFRKLAYLSNGIGFTFLVFAYEIYLKRTKYIFTIISTLLMVFIVIVPFNVAQYFLGFLNGVTTYFVIVILLTLTKWARTEFKRVSYLVMIGFILGSFGFGLSVFQIKSINIVPLIIPPILYILGNLISVVPLYMKPEFFSKNTRFWPLMGILTIVLNFGSLFISLISNVELFFKIFMTFTYIFFFFSVLLGIRFISSESMAEAKEVQNVLRMFTKPQKITEEEVSISKEKKICLVCKGKVVRFNSYICECDTLYCEKCVRELSDLENACWVCDTPFDESKPSKSFKKEEDITVEESKEPQKDLKKLKK